MELKSVLTFEKLLLFFLVDPTLLHGVDLQLQLQKKVIWSSRAHMTISTNFQRKIAEPEISYGRAL